MENKTSDGGERRQIPGRGVVPDGEERLQIRRRRPSIGINLAVTPQTPTKRVVVPHVLAAQFQVVPPERDGEVVADGLRILQDVDWAAPDRIAAKLNLHRSAIQYRMIRKDAALPSDGRLILPLVVRETSSELIHGAVADDLSQSREILGRNPLPRAAVRRVGRGRSAAATADEGIVQIVVSRGAHRQTCSGGKLIIQSPQKLV